MKRVFGFGLAALGVATLDYILFGRSRQLRWGATDEEVAAALPGDDLVPDADLIATRRITIQRRPEDVWPWIAQLGQGRGGLYSYDGLENLMGCDMHSADRIVPEWQSVQVGDQLRLHPEIGLAVSVADPGHALVVRGGVPMGQTPPPYDFSWAFVLREQPDATTRLLVRERYHYTQWWAPALVEPVEILSFVTSRKMLLGIKRRAETYFQPVLAASTPA